jgi:hypothetical protein
LNTAYHLLGYLRNSLNYFFHYLLRFKLPIEARKGLENDLTQVSVMTKHMSKSIRVNNGSKTVLEKFGKLSPCNLVIRTYLAKTKEN